MKLERQQLLQLLFLRQPEFIWMDKSLNTLVAVAECRMRAQVPPVVAAVRK